MEGKLHKELGDYILKQKLGGGLDGNAYYGKHIKRCGDYVVKEFNKKEHGTHELEVMKILSPLRHDNIIKCFNFLPGNSKSIESTAIEMEICPGGSLQDEIDSCKQNKETFPEIQIVSWLIQIVNGLEAIHSQNIVHLDIKPGNILIGKGGVLKIADFGIAEILHSSDFTAARFYGSLAYTAPEIYRSNKGTKMSDIWSLGVLAYEFCCLDKPFKAQTALGMNILVWKQYYSPVSIPKKYSKDLVLLIHSMLQRDQTYRPNLAQIKKLLHLIKYKNLLVLFNKYKTIDFGKNQLVNLVNHITSPYCLRYFLRQNMGELFEREHKCNRLHKEGNIITYLTFYKNGRQEEKFSEGNRVTTKILDLNGEFSEITKEVSTVQF